MRLVSFGDPGAERPGVLIGSDILDLREARPAWPSSWRGILMGNLWPELESMVAGAEQAVGLPTVPLGSVRLGAPVPDPSKIVAVGLNYRDHAEEQNKQPPEVPLLFSKAPSCLVGPNDPIVLPDDAVENQVDAEAELCVVIATRGKNVRREDAMSHILGYTAFNDVSGRGAQYGDKQWFRGKSFDTFGPCGPWIVTKDELGDPSGLSLESHWGETRMQSGNTSNLIHDVPALIAYISKQMTLEPGDLIATGTPSGVGVFRDPKVFLQRGMTVRICLEKVGELINLVV
ncbi:MAG: fumarylacetoacetate hydrolase family protein [Candidatus Eisenbacteria bacterium]|uniref:Fumarylacetoacetate hydrolase family protein n=1 Tax=Eiseniibacteriota bacterium TaxID=2212470 RepID=A0A956NAU7_UNCEI|nr:fumarylacetoacetate hydrolase family protein [Candidatus Eisenbacteria bacterium]